MESKTPDISNRFSRRDLLKSLAALLGGAALDRFLGGQLKTPEQPRTEGTRTVSNLQYSVVDGFFTFTNCGRNDVKLYPEGVRHFFPQDSSNPTKLLISLIIYQGRDAILSTVDGIDRLLSGSNLTDLDNFNTKTLELRAVCPNDPTQAEIMISYILRLDNFSVEESAKLRANLESRDRSQLLEIAVLIYLKVSLGHIRENNKKPYDRFIELFIDIDKDNHLFTIESSGPGSTPALPTPIPFNADSDNS